MKNRGILCLVAVMAANLALAASVPQNAVPSLPRSFAYILQADKSSKRSTDAVSHLAACGRDWFVLDAFFGGADASRWTKEDLAAIRRGKPDRRVIAYLSIGEAEDYRPYWNKAWKPAAGTPSFLMAENPEWKGNYRVKYWQADWQKIILKELDNIVASGFDGVYLDIVDGFETFEYDPVKKDWIENRKNPETGRSFREDMILWVKAIASRGRLAHPGFLVIPQNGSQLLADPTFVETIDAIGIEDLFTNGNRLQPAEHRNSVLGDLSRMTAARKPVLVIEYGKSAKMRNESILNARKHHFLLLLTDRQLTELGQGVDAAGTAYGASP